MDPNENSIVVPNMRMPADAAPFEMMVSYAHADEDLKNELRKHLSLLQRQGLVSQWHDRLIAGGREWQQEIATHLESAQIILLLVSPDFLASDYCYDTEMKRALERHDDGTARVIPVFLRPCDWAGAPFSRLQGLPTNAEPVTSTRWSSRDEAFSIIARGIRVAVEDLQSQGQRAGHAIPPVHGSSHASELVRADPRSLLHALTVRVSHRGPLPQGASVNAERVLVCLRQTSWRLFCADPSTATYDHDTVVAALLAASDRPDLPPAEVLALLVASDVLVETNSGGVRSYSFLHSFVRETLAAWYLTSEIERVGWAAAMVSWCDADQRWQTGRVETLLDRSALDPDWEPLFLSLASLLPNPQPLFALLADEGRDDHFRHRRSLFWRCYEAVPSEKEAQLLPQAEPLFRSFARDGHKALGRRPQRWRRWLRDARSLARQPLACRRLTAMIADYLGHDDRGRMRLHLAHDVVELFVDAARTTGGSVAAESLLLLCEEFLEEPYALSYAAAQLIEIADSQHKPELVRRLVRHIRTPDGKLWRQIPIAQAMLRSASRETSGAAFSFLVSVVHSEEDEAWLTFRARNALAEAIGTPHEADAASVIIEAFLDPSPTLYP